MICSVCGNDSGDGVNYCRKCGTTLVHVSSESLQAMPSNESSLKDPDELTGRGIAKVFAGDGFFMVAVILSATSSPASSLLWLVLLIPAFAFFGQGASDILNARQIRRKRKELAATHTPDQLPPKSESVLEIKKPRISGELLYAGSVTDSTTQDLKLK